MYSLWLQILKNLTPAGQKPVDVSVSSGEGELMNFAPELDFEINPENESSESYMDPEHLALIQINSCGHVIAS